MPLLFASKGRRQHFTRSGKQHIHHWCWIFCVRVFFDKVASNRNPGSLIWFEGHPIISSQLWMGPEKGPVIKAIPPLTTLRVLKRRSSPGQGRWLRRTKSWDWSKEDTDCPLAWPTRELPWNSSTPLKASERDRLKTPWGTLYHSFLKKACAYLLFVPRHDFSTQILPVS